MKQLFGGLVIGFVVGSAFVRFAVYGGSVVRSAGAQSLNFNCRDFPVVGLCGGGAPAHAKTGDADMDRAVALCDAHRNTETNVIPVWPEFEKDYDASCVVVMREWSASEAVKAEKERQAKAAADKGWLEDYTKRLKP